MDLTLRNKISEKLYQDGIWCKMMNLKIYTVDELIEEFSKYMTDELIKLLRKNVARVQYYCDERIIEPLRGEK